jgi:transposase-like protein
MPWKASSVMEERLRFVARLLDGEAMTDVCREFGVSRKTGYKIFDRYNAFLIRASWRRDRVRTSDQSSKVCAVETTGCSAMIEMPMTENAERDTRLLRTMLRKNANN